MKKRILSVLITVVMLIGMLPTTVFAEDTTYDLWVGGVQVTDANKDNVDGNNKVSYDPATKTLTLNGYSYTGEGYEYDSNSACAAIYFNPADENAELTIELVGTNTVIIDNSECTSHAIYIANGNLIIEGNGSLTATGDTGIYAWGNISISDENTSVIATGNYGIQTNGGDIDIDGGKVEANGGYNGIVAYGNISISGGEVKATATPEYGTGIYAEGNIDIDGGKVEANGGYGGIYADGNIDIDGDKVDATGSLDYGIYAAGPLTINGGIVTVKGSEAGIYVENNITIDSGTVKATASGDYGIGIVAYAVTVNGGTVEAMSTGEYGYGITTYDDGISCNGDFDVYAGESAPGELVTSPTTSTYNSKYVKITPVPPHEHCVCGATHAPVGDHTAEDEKTFTAVSTYAELVAAATTGGSVYLTGDITLEAPLTVSQNLSLCLNGYDLIYNSADSVIIVSNSKTLNITDCGSTGTITGSTGDHGAVQNGGTFNLYAGTITANKRGVYNGGTFSMYGGNIAYNSDDGVWNAEGGTFTLHAGKITYNTGWGVNNNGGTFTMYNGEISHNSHNAAENAVKYGVMNDGTFTMNGGKISSNTGDGVYTTRVFTMNGGEISSNTGDGVYTTHVFTMNGGEISGNDRGVMYKDGTASVSGAPVINGNTNGNFCDYQGGYYLTVSGALTDGAYIGVTLDEKIGEAAGPSMYDDTLPAAPDYIEYFYSDEGYGIYPEGDYIFVGNYITEQPNAVNNYKVKTNDDANAIYQWYSVETDEVTVTYDFLVEQDTGFDWMYNGNFDSQTNKWEPVGFSGGFGYLFVALNAGETFIAEFDSDIPTGYIALLGGWNNDNVIQATRQNGNIYTFKATEAGQYILTVVTEDEDPTALSEVVIPNVVCQMDAFVYTPLDGQTSATLDTTNLTTGTYVCKATWNMGTPDNSEDDYSLTSATVTLQYYNVIFDYGTFGSETKTVLSGETVTPPAPVFAGKVLVGWYTDSSFATEFNFSDAITADNTTIYAKFADYEGDKEALNNNIDAAKAELQGKIDAVESALAGKADAATLAQAITDLNTAKTNIQTLLEQIDDYEDADTALKNELNTKIETADNLINTAISDLTSRVETLESELAAAKSDISTNASEIAELTADLATLNASLTDLSNNLTNDYATKAELTSAINSAKDTINSSIDALTIRVQNLETGLAEANGKININTTDVGTLKTDVSDLKTWKDNAQDAIEALETLTATQGTNISALQTAAADLQTAVNTANDKITAAENRIAALEGKVSALETAKQELEDAVSALQTAVADKADTATVNAAIAELKTAIEALEAVKNNYIGADDDLRTELEGKIATAKGEAIASAETLVNNAKAELQSKIDAKADAATTTAAIQNLQAAVAALEAVKDDYATADATLKTELEGKIANAQTAAISAAETLVNNAKAELQSKIDAKADAATTTAAIQNLQAAVAAFEAVKDDYATADATLKTELEGKIANAQTAAISAAETLVNNAKAELQSKIDAKADAATTTAAIQNLQAAVAALEAVKDDYATADATLKTELEGKIANAQTAAISAAETLVNNAKAELQSKIDAKADAATTTAAIQNLQAAVAALEAVKDDYATADATLKTELEGKIETAKSEAITAANTALTTAKNELSQAIALKADTAMLNAKVDVLNTAIANSESVAKAYADTQDAALKAELQTAIANAKSEAIGAAQLLVDNAKAELQTAIDTKADTATVNAAIANMQNAITALEAAKDNYASADAALKLELEAAIERAKQEAIEASKGYIPYIGTNGNWWIGDTDTGVDANGIKGDTGEQGPQGEKGDKGDTGATGNGIASITTSKANGITTVTIKFTDPNMADVVFTIEDGADGAKGDKGDTGAQGAQGDKGDKGDTGAQGEKGDKGNTGAAGADGVGIANIEKTSSDGNVDTYTITLTNGTTYTFTVTNGTNGTDGKDGKDGTNGKDGVDGKDGTNGTNGVDGKDGANGADGQTPYIGENGNWWIGDTDTGVKAAGDDGKDGAIIVAIAVSGTALISNIALIAWALIKKKRLF